MTSGEQVPSGQAASGSAGSAVQAPPYLSESRPATPESVSWARALLTRFATDAGVEGEQLEDVRLLVSEAVTNVVRHAYGGSPGEVYLIAAIVPGELWVVVADDGEGMSTKAGTNSGLGLGLALMAKLSDDLTIAARSSGGVEARMRFSLTPPGGAGVSREGR